MRFARIIYLLIFCVRGYQHDQVSFNLKVFFEFKFYDNNVSLIGKIIIISFTILIIQQF